MQVNPVHVCWRFNFLEIRISPFVSVLDWSFLATRFLSICFLIPHSQKNWGEKIRWRSRWIEIKTDTSFKNYAHKQNILGIWKINLIYSHLKLEWWETKTKNKTSFRQSPPFSKVQLQSFIPNPLPYPFPRKCRKMWNRGLQSVRNSFSLLLFPPHTLPLIQDEVTHTARPSGKKAPDLT